MKTRLQKEPQGNIDDMMKYYTQMAKGKLPKVPFDATTINNMEMNQVVTSDEVPVWKLIERRKMTRKWSVTEADCPPGSFKRTKQFEKAGGSVFDNTNQPGECEVEMAKVKLYPSDEEVCDEPLMRGLPTPTPRSRPCLVEDAVKSPEELQPTLNDWQAWESNLDTSTYSPAEQQKCWNFRIPVFDAISQSVNGIVGVVICNLKDLLKTIWRPDLNPEKCNQLLNNLINLVVFDAIVIWLNNICDE